jgi:hypothetical protein
MVLHVSLARQRALMLMLSVVGVLGWLCGTIACVEGDVDFWLEWP